MCRLVQVRRVYLEAPHNMLRGAGTLQFITDFFPHLTELTVRDLYANSSRFLHFYISLMRRGVNVEASGLCGGAGFEFYFGLSQSLDLFLDWPAGAAWTSLLAALEGVTLGVTSLNIWYYRTVTEREAMRCHEVANEVLSKLAGRRGKLTEVSMPKVTLTDYNIFLYSSQRSFFWRQSGP